MATPLDIDNKHSSRSAIVVITREAPRRALNDHQNPGSIQVVKSMHSFHESFIPEQFQANGLIVSFAR